MSTARHRAMRMQQQVPNHGSDASRAARSSAEEEEEHAQDSVPSPGGAISANRATSVENRDKAASGCEDVNGVDDDDLDDDDRDRDYRSTLEGVVMAPGTPTRGGRGPSVAPAFKTPIDDRAYVSHVTRVAAHRIAQASPRHWQRGISDTVIVPRSRSTPFDEKKCVATALGCGVVLVSIDDLDMDARAATERDASHVHSGVFRLADYEFACIDGWTTVRNAASAARGSEDDEGVIENAIVVSSAGCGVDGEEVRTLMGPVQMIYLAWYSNQVKASRVGPGMLEVLQYAQSCVRSARSQDINERLRASARRRRPAIRAPLTPVIIPAPIQRGLQKMVLESGYLGRLCQDGKCGWVLETVAKGECILPPMGIGFEAMPREVMKKAQKMQAEYMLSTIPNATESTNRRVSKDAEIVMHVLQDVQDMPMTQMILRVMDAVEPGCLQWKHLARTMAYRSSAKRWFWKNDLAMAYYLLGFVHLRQKCKFDTDISENMAKRMFSFVVVGMDKLFGLAAQDPLGGSSMRDCVHPPADFSRFLGLVVQSVASHAFLENDPRRDSSLRMHVDEAPVCIGPGVPYTPRLSVQNVGDTPGDPQGAEKLFSGIFKPQAILPRSGCTPVRLGKRKASSIGSGSGDVIVVNLDENSSVDPAGAWTGRTRRSTKGKASGQKHAANEVAEVAGGVENAEAPRSSKEGTGVAEADKGSSGAAGNGGPLLTEDEGTKEAAGETMCPAARAGKAAEVLAERQSARNPCAAPTKHDSPAAAGKGCPVAKAPDSLFAALSAVATAAAAAAAVEANGGRSSNAAKKGSPAAVATKPVAAAGAVPAQGGPKNPRADSSTAAEKGSPTAAAMAATKTSDAAGKGRTAAAATAATDSSDAADKGSAAAEMAATETSDAAGKGSAVAAMAATDSSNAPGTGSPAAAATKPAPAAGAAPAEEGPKGTRADRSNVAAKESPAASATDSSNAPGPGSPAAVAKKPVAAAGAATAEGVPKRIPRSHSLNAAENGNPAPATTDNSNAAGKGSPAAATKPAAAVYGSGGVTSKFAGWLSPSWFLSRSGKGSPAAAATAATVSSDAPGRGSPAAAVTKPVAAAGAAPAEGGRKIPRADRSNVAEKGSLAASATDSSNAAVTGSSRAAATKPAAAVYGSGGPTAVELDVAKMQKSKSFWSTRTPPQPRQFILGTAAAAAEQGGPAAAAQSTAEAEAAEEAAEENEGRQLTGKKRGQPEPVLPSPQALSSHNVEGRHSKTEKGDTVEGPQLRSAAAKRQAGLGHRPQGGVPSCEPGTTIDTIVLSPDPVDPMIVTTPSGKDAAGSGAGDEVVNLESPEPAAEDPECVPLATSGGTCGFLATALDNSPGEKEYLVLGYTAGMANAESLAERHGVIPELIGSHVQARGHSIVHGLTDTPFFSYMSATCFETASRACAYAAVTLWARSRAHAECSRKVSVSSNPNKKQKTDGKCCGSSLGRRACRVLPNLPPCPCSACVDREAKSSRGVVVYDDAHSTSQSRLGGCPSVQPGTCQFPHDPVLTKVVLKEDGLHADFRVDHSCVERGMEDVLILKFPKVTGRPSGGTSSFSPGPSVVFGDSDMVVTEGYHRAMSRMDDDHLDLFTLCTAYLEGSLQQVLRGAVSPWPRFLPGLDRSPDPRMHHACAQLDSVFTLPMTGLGCRVLDAEGVRVRGADRFEGFHVVTPLDVKPNEDTDKSCSTGNADAVGKCDDGIRFKTSAHNIQAPEPPPELVPAGSLLLLRNDVLHSTRFMDGPNDMQSIFPGVDGRRAVTVTDSQLIRVRAALQPKLLASMERFESMDGTETTTSTDE